MKQCIVFIFVFVQLLNAQQMQEVKDRLDSYFITGTTPGFQYVVMDKNGLVFAYNRGMENIEKNKEINPKSVFKIFSTTKAFTAIAIMQLEEQGKLNLDDPISTYIKDSYLKHDVTIRQLLTHTAGLSNPFPKWIHFEDEHQDFDYDSFSLEIRKKYAKNSRPGKKHKYSNISSLYLAMIVQNVSGENYIDYVDNHIIIPMEMEDDFSFDIPQENYATGYHKNSWFNRMVYKVFFDTEKLFGTITKDWIALNKFYLNGAAYGGLHGNADGLATFAQQLFLSENTILNKKTLDLMTTPVVKTRHMYKQQCLGWFKGEFEGFEYLAHAGGGGGFSVELRYYPEQGIVTAFAMNRTQTLKDLSLLNRFDASFLK